MKSTLRPASMTYVAYVLLLLAFVALGIFVSALATDNALAGIIGAVVVVLMVTSTAGFRAAARIRARSNDSGIEIDGANIWEQPLRRDQIDRYRLTYRGERTGREETAQPTSSVVVEPVEPIVELDRRAA